MKPAGALLLALALAAGLGGVARGELAENGNLLVSFQGGISPHALPRLAPAPVAVWIESTVKATDGADPPPQLEQIAFAINRGGRIFDRGLPNCLMRDIQPATMAAAKKICGAAIVGHGHVRVQVSLAKTTPFTFEGPLLAFNTKPAHGHRRILVQAYGVRPPAAFVLVFTVRHRPGTFGTVISAALPESARSWAYITHFDLRLQRRYAYRGKTRSFLSAICAAPAGFPGAVYPFAEGRLRFADKRLVSSTLVRSCAVRK